MKKIKKLFCLSLVFVLLLGLSMLVAYQPKEHFAHAAVNSESNEVMPNGLYTSLSLSINGEDGRIWATVKNDFTLFPATVIVIVELYSSDIYYESHEKMELVSINSINDLNMGQTIVAEALTGGVKKYWQARMRYKIDSGSWQNRNTATLLYDADGNCLGYY